MTSMPESRYTSSMDMEQYLSSIRERAATLRQASRGEPAGAEESARRRALLRESFDRLLGDFPAAAAGADAVRRLFARADGDRDG